MSDLDSRRRLRSSSTYALVVPSTRLSTVDDCAFPVAAARVWNTVPAEVTCSPSLPTFKRRLKTVLFARTRGVFKGGGGAGAAPQSPIVQEIFALFR